MSGYLDPGCLSPDWPVELEVGLDLAEVDSPAVAASWSDTATFSLSVWLAVAGLQRSEPAFPSLRLAPACAAAALPLTLEDLAGLGRDRYCRVSLEPLQPSRTPSSSGCEPSKLVLRTPPAPLPRAAEEDLGALPRAAEEDLGALPRAAEEDLGALPRGAEPLASVAPLEVMRVPPAPGIFLYPKDAVVAGRPMPEGGFLPSSPLLFPASEGERWMAAGPLEGALPFSEALASSVLPVSGHKETYYHKEKQTSTDSWTTPHTSGRLNPYQSEAQVCLPGVLWAGEVPLVLGGVMPTWAVMPRLHEPVWDIWASAAAFCPASSY